MQRRKPSRRKAAASPCAPEISKLCKLPPKKIRKRYNAEVLAEAFDVTDATAVQPFVADVAKKFGGIDICVTNAGGPPAKGFLAASLEEWQRAIELNFLSTVYFAREVIPFMQRKRWGRIITI